jgi:putative spermidine/putrescine transport system permease protein
MAAFYLWPVINIVRGSFSDESGRPVGLQNYAEVLSSNYFLDALLFTFRVSLISTLIAAVLAVIMALALRGSFAGKKLALFISQYNLSVPRLAAAMLMVFLLSQTGLLSSLAHSLGLAEAARDFPWLVNDAKGIGLCVVFVWKFFPYIGLSALGVLQSTSLEYEQQAATLGIGKWRRFFHVTLPSITPAVAIPSIFVFAASFGDYEVPAILGSAQSRSLSVMLYLKYADPDMKNQPEAFAMMLLTALALTAVVLVYRLAANARTPQGQERAAERTRSQ